MPQGAPGGGRALLLLAFPMGPARPPPQNRSFATPLARHAPEPRKPLGRKGIGRRRPRQQCHLCPTDDAHALRARADADPDTDTPSRASLRGSTERRRHHHHHHHRRFRPTSGIEPRAPHP
eukprot:scaffold3348_cov379-Prasinococcus_capsulatus_cf.AAC.1